MTDQLEKQFPDLFEPDRRYFSAEEHESLTARLAAFIDHLIDHDFNGLVQLLYRIDVSESKLKSMLNNNSAADASHVIAAMIIERQLEKLRTRQQTSRPDNIPDDEKW